MSKSAKQKDVSESTAGAAEGSPEVERGLSQLKVTNRTDDRDWRTLVDQGHQHKSGTESALKETDRPLDKFHNESSRSLEKVSSQEKYISNQPEHLAQECHAAEALLTEPRERCPRGKGRVAERTGLRS